MVEDARGGDEDVGDVFSSLRRADVPAAVAELAVWDSLTEADVARHVVFLGHALEVALDLRPGAKVWLQCGFGSNEYV